MDRFFIGFIKIVTSMNLFASTISFFRSCVLIWTYEFTSFDR